jgi:peptidoglycan/LPS O-acetylase OafA/YrhL
VEPEIMVSSSNAHSRYREVRFFGALNGIRFLCIAAVLWHHSPAFAAMEDPARILMRGFTGVDFFFVLSGFLITTLLLREEARRGRFSLAGFYRRRMLRILPVYFLVITAVSAYYVLWQSREDLAPLVPYYYLFLANFLKEDIPLLAITWSLSIEEQYYLIWPLLLMVLGFSMWARASVLVVLTMICVLSAAGALAFLGWQPVETEHAVWGLPATGYSAILIGSVLAVVLHTRRGFDLIHAALGRRVAPIVCFAALIAGYAALPVTLQGWPNLVLHVTMAACIASVVVREDTILHPVLSVSPVARMGEISYGIYLYHLIGLHAANVAAARSGLEAAASPWAVTLLYLVAAIVISELSFRYYESYFLRLKDRRPRSLPTRSRPSV